MKTIKIKRSKWLRGDLSHIYTNKSPSGSVFHPDSLLLDSNGNMCCLGFAICQISKPKQKEILDLYSPEDYFSSKSFLTELTENRIVNNELAKKAIAINDDSYMIDTEREEKLTRLFKEHGYKLVFND